jgi:hypothetical protein
MPVLNSVINVMGCLFKAWPNVMIVSAIATGMALPGVQAAGAGPENQADHIILKDGRLSAHIVSMSLQDVMRELGRLSGAEVHWVGESGQEAISKVFEELPFTEALRRILDEKDFKLVYPANNRAGSALPRQIWIYPEGQAQAPPPASQKQPASPPPANNEPLPAAQAIETLIGTATSHPKAPERLDAITQLAGYAGEDPRIRPLLAEVARRDGSGQVRAAAKELLENLGNAE